MEQDEKILRKLMKKKMEPGPLREELEAMRIPATYGNGMWLHLVKKAAGGDLSAAKYIREAMGEDKPQALDEDTLRSLPTAVLREMAKGPGNGLPR